MSDTPRIDRAWVCVKREHRQDPSYYAAAKLLHEAQSMERELAAVTAENAALREALDQAITQFQIIASLVDDEGVENIAVNSADFIQAHIDAAKGVE